MQTDSKGAIAAIGTTLEINSHVMLEDGRMGIESIGAILQPSLCSVHNIMPQERLLPAFLWQGECHCYQFMCA